MIVLYIPFPRDASGNLAPLVNRWKDNHALNFTRPILTMFSGDDIDLDETKGCFEIYICAHGSDDYPSELGNHADEDLSDWVDMETVAERFSSDFLIVSHLISTIHCYCCGNEDKNQSLASLFRSHLLRAEMPICSYGGSLYGADSQGLLWCIKNNEKMPISKTRRIIYNEIDQSFAEPWMRKPLKVLELERFIEQAREKRIDRFFARQKEKRQEAFKQLRYCAESPSAGSSS